MKLNQQLLKINRAVLICFVASASISAIAAQMLSDYENYLITTITIIIGYVVYFGIFSCLFYFENRKRYKTMDSGLIKKEIRNLISSFGIGEIIYLAIRGPSFLYFLELEIQPYAASIISEVLATVMYMITITMFLKKTKTF